MIKPWELNVLLEELEHEVFVLHIFLELLEDILVVLLQLLVYRLHPYTQKFFLPDLFTPVKLDDVRDFAFNARICLLLNLYLNICQFLSVSEMSHQPKLEVTVVSKLSRSLDIEDVLILKFVVAMP